MFNPFFVHCTLQKTISCESIDETTEMDARRIPIIVKAIHVWEPMGSEYTIGLRVELILCWKTALHNSVSLDINSGCIKLSLSDAVDLVLSLHLIVLSPMMLFLESQHLLDLSVTHRCLPLPHISRKRCVRTHSLQQRFRRHCTCDLIIDRIENLKAQPVRFHG